MARWSTWSARCSTMAMFANWRCTGCMHPWRRTRGLGSRRGLISRSTSARRRGDTDRVGRSSSWRVSTPSRSNICARCRYRSTAVSRSRQRSNVTSAAMVVIGLRPVSRRGWTCLAASRAGGGLSESEQHIRGSEIVARSTAILRICRSPEQRLWQAGSSPEAKLDHLLHRFGPELIRVLPTSAHTHLGHSHQLWRPDVYESRGGSVAQTDCDRIPDATDI